MPVFHARCNSRLSSHCSWLNWHQSSILDAQDTCIIPLAQTPALALVCQKIKLRGGTTAPSETWLQHCCSHLPAVTPCRRQHSPPFYPRCLSPLLLLAPSLYLGSRYEKTSRHQGCLCEMISNSVAFWNVDNISELFFTSLKAIS